MSSSYSNNNNNYANCFSSAAVGIIVTAVTIHTAAVVVVVVAGSSSEECKVGNNDPSTCQQQRSFSTIITTIVATMIESRYSLLVKTSKSSIIVSFTFQLQQLLLWLGVSHDLVVGGGGSDQQQLITPMDVTRTTLTVVVTLLFYHVLFGNRHWRRRRRLAKELNVAKEQLTFLQEKVRQPSIERTKRRKKSKTKSMIGGRFRSNSNVGEDTESSSIGDDDDDDDNEIRIFVEGAFDMFHFGHANAFRLARSLGTRLIVGVNSDTSITECKGAPLMNEHERLVMVQQCKFVDQVIAGTPYVMNQEYLNYIFDTYRVDYVVHGEDPCIVNGRDVYETAKAAGKFRTVPRTEGVSTTDIVGRMLLLTKEHHMAANIDDDDNKKDTTTTGGGTALGTRSKFLTTTRLIQLFSADLKHKSPTSDMKVVYIDGSWDIFNPSHVALLKGAKERGDFLIVGIHSDAVVNEHKGMNLPLLNLHERVLSVNGCRYVDDVLIDAPYEISPDMIASLGIKEVVHGTCGDGGEDYCSIQDPRYKHAKAAGIFHVMKSQSDFQMDNIFKRIEKNQQTFQARFERKMKAETDHLKEKYGK